MERIETPREFVDRFESNWGMENLNALVVQVASHDTEVERMARADEASRWLPYARHKYGCDYMQGWTEKYGTTTDTNHAPCTCGLDALRLAITQGKPEGAQDDKCKFCGTQQPCDGTGCTQGSMPEVRILDQTMGMPEMWKSSNKGKPDPRDTFSDGSTDWHNWMRDTMKIDPSDEKSISLVWAVIARCKTEPDPRDGLKDDEVRKIIDCTIAAYSNELETEPNEETWAKIGDEALAALEAVRT